MSEPTLFQLLGDEIMRAERVCGDEYQAAGTVSRKSKTHLLALKRAFKALTEYGDPYADIVEATGRVQRIADAVVRSSDPEAVRALAEELAEVLSGAAVNVAIPALAAVLRRLAVQLDDDIELDMEELTIAVICSLATRPRGGELH